MTRRSALGGGAPVGMRMAMQDVGPTATLEDGSVWIRSGVFGSPATYPRAAGRTGLKAVFFEALSPTMGNVDHIATNGAGTWVVASGDVTNIWRSTDDGLTWAPVAHGLSASVACVRWLNGRFWLVGNDPGAAGLVAAESVTGTGWTARPILAGAGVFGTAPSDIAWTGTNYIVIAGRNSSGGIFTSNNGTAWTQRTAPTSGSTGQGAWVAARSDGTAVASNHSDNGSVFVSTDHGATWTSVTLPSSRSNQSSGSFSAAVVVSGGRFFLPANNSSRILTADNPTTTNGWASRDTPWQVESSNPVAVAAVGARILIPAGYGIWGTVDGVTWDFWHTNIVSVQRRIGMSGSTLVWPQGTNALVRAAATLDSPNAVASGGRPSPFNGDSLSLYAKVA